MKVGIKRRDMRRYAWREEIWLIFHSVVNALGSAINYAFWRKKVWNKERCICSKWLTPLPPHSNASSILSNAPLVLSFDPLYLGPGAFSMCHFRPFGLLNSLPVEHRFCTNFYRLPFTSQELILMLQRQKQPNPLFYKISESPLLRLYTRPRPYNQKLTL